MHAAFVADFQRLAQNICAQISLSFFNEGGPATIATTARACERFQKKSNQARPAHEIYDNAIVGMIGLSPFQTHAVQPSRSILLSCNPDLAVADAMARSRHLMCNIVKHGRPFFDFISGHHPNSPSPLLAAGLPQHLEWTPERLAKNKSVARRADFAATYWGADWLTHAYLGLAQLAHAAVMYNRSYCPNGPVIRQTADSSRGLWVGLSQAIARIPYFWLETTNERAFRKEVERLSASCVRNAKRHEGKAEEVKTGGSTDNNRICVSAKIRAEDWQASSIFDDPAATIKERDVASAMKRARENPPEGMPGYTAQYRPHLWWDCTNDDIGFWIGREQALIGGQMVLHSTANPAVSGRQMREVILTDVERYGDWTPGIAAKVNQNLAMTIGAFSTDPQHSWFRRKGF